MCGGGARTRLAVYIALVVKTKNDMATSSSFAKAVDGSRPDERAPHHSPNHQPGLPPHTHTHTTNTNTWSSGGVCLTAAAGHEREGEVELVHDPDSVGLGRERVLRNRPGWSGAGRGLALLM